MNRTRLILIPAHAAEPAPFIVFDDVGGVLERGRLDFGDPVALHAMRTVAVAPGAEVLVRWLDLPGGGPAQQRVAALWMLKDDLAARPDRLSLALGSVPPTGEPRLVAVVDTALLDAWKAHLSALGAAADVILPLSLVPAPPTDPDAAHVIAFGDELAIRAHGLAATVQADLADILIGARRRIDTVDPEAIERQLIEAARRPPVNLLDDGRADAATRRTWMRAAVLAALLLVSPVVLTTAAALRDDGASREAQAQARALSVQADPALARSDDPVADRLEQIDAAPPPGGVVGAAAALAVAIEGVPGATMESLSLDPQTGVRAGLAYPAFQDLATIQQAVARHGLVLTELSTVEDAGRVVSDVVVEAAR